MFILRVYQKNNRDCESHTMGISIKIKKEE